MALGNPSDPSNAPGNSPSAGPFQKETKPAGFDWLAPASGVLLGCFEKCQFDCLDSESVALHDYLKLEGGVPGFGLRPFLTVLVIKEWCLAGEDEYILALIVLALDQDSVGWLEVKHGIFNIDFNRDVAEGVVHRWVEGEFGG